MADSTGKQAGNKAEKQAGIKAQTDVAPQQAMLDYLDELLHDATAVTAAEPVAEIQVKPEVVAPPVEVEPEVIELPAVATVVAEQAAAALRSEDALPEWAETEFEVLLFEANGLLLAVPLIELAGILRMPKKLDQLPRQHDWMMGVMQVDDGENMLSIVDTLRWIAPERMGAVEPQPARYLVRLPESDWALSCQKLFDSVTMRAEDVQWRTNRTRRRWLRGTVRDRMCALLDTRALSRALDQDDRSEA